MTRSWAVHGFADESARLFIGATLASPSILFPIDDHPDHAHPESGPRFENLAHRAFSSTVSGNVRILEEIRQFGIISSISKGQILRRLLRSEMNLRSENLRVSDFQGEGTLLIPRSLLRGAFIVGIDRGLRHGDAILNVHRCAKHRFWEIERELVSHMPTDRDRGEVSK